MSQDTPPGRDKAGETAADELEGSPSEHRSEDAPADPGPEAADTDEAARDAADEPAEPAIAADEAAKPEDDRDAEPGPEDLAEEPPPVEDAPQVIERTVEVRRSGGVAALALIIALAGVGGSAYLWWQLRAASGDDPGAELAAGQAALESRVGELRNRLDRLESAAEAPAPAADLRPAVDANRSANERLEGLLGSLEDRLGRLEAAPPPASSPASPLVEFPLPETGPGWEQAEIELLLRVAQRQLALAGDVATARAALEEADRSIERLDDPSLTPVRRQIADDLMALRAVETPDLDGIAFRLGSLQARIAGLPVREGAARGQTSSGETAAEPEDGGLDRLERKSREFISGLVRVRDSGSDERVFHTPAELWFLRRNLELELQAARVALLTGNPAAYRDSLRKAGRWTEAYFDPGDPGVQAFLEAVTELADRPVAVELPDVSGSLRVYLEVAAKAPAG